MERKPLLCLLGFLESNALAARVTAGCTHVDRILKRPDS